MPQGCAHSIATPQIKGKKLSLSGATTDPNVKCILREGHNHGTVGGRIIVPEGYLDLGVNLAAWDTNGRLICSWSIQPDTTKDGFVTYWFILRKELVEGAKLDFFTKENGMMELHLDTVRVLPKKRS